MKRLNVNKENLKKGAWAAGGIALLAAVSTLCVKGLKAVDKKLKAKREVQDFDEETFEMEEVVEEESVVEEPVAEEAVEESAEEEKTEE